MIILKGKYNEAKVFTDNLEPSARAQIENLLNQEFVAGSKIRIMPDVHAGAGCTIGTTMTIDDKVVPNLVGVDIGCGMETLALENKKVDLKELDALIHREIPSGFSIRRRPHAFQKEIDLEKLKAADAVNLDRAKLSIGTLGGGNHFIELGKDEEGLLYLVVHTGSRHLGKQIAEHYQRAAVRDLAKKNIKIDKSLAYTEGELFDDYLHDMALVQRYADLNRKAIVGEIVDKMGFVVKEQFSTVHNYIDLKTKILRKGAVSARAGEKLLIPINMRDGSLICTGKGNPDWNYSAPHGAGRILSRRAAKQSISIKDFIASMEGIYTTTADMKTIDEAPFAYKPMSEILRHIDDTVVVNKEIKPLYNYKAQE